MDTLYWTQLNPDIVFEPTIKLAYNRYAYKLEISCTGVAFLRGGYENIWDFISSRQHARKMNWGGSWRMSRMQVPSDTEADALVHLQDLLENDSFSFKKRIEEPVIQLYSDNAQDLVSFANRFRYPLMISKIMMPRTTQEQQLIEKGLIIRRTPVTWKYRFNIREARYSWDTRSQLAQYLENLGDDVHIPPSTWKSLRDSKSGYIFGGYIDANDKNLATFIHLISSNFIRSIDEFHVIEKGK